MTKKTLKEKYMEWNRNINALDARQLEILKELQELCAEKSDGHRWRSDQTLLEKIIKVGDESAIFRAFALYNEFYKSGGQLKALGDLATATNNFKI